MGRGRNVPPFLLARQEAERPKVDKVDTKNGGCCSRDLVDATHGGNNGRLRVTEVCCQQYTPPVFTIVIASRRQVARQSSFMPAFWIASLRSQ
jgi:hypothetical protein